MFRALPFLLVVIASSVAVAAPPARRVVVILPPVADEKDAPLALVMQSRASTLLAATGRYHDVHAKMILRTAEREGIAPASFGDDENAATIGRRLGGERVVYGTLVRQEGGFLLSASAGKGAKPIAAKLPASLPEAVEAG